MPRIDADTIADHVAQRETAVFDAAIRLFVERGYREVTLADIAAEVGLARNSLYRYFPDKAHIVLRWLRRELPVEAARARELLTGDEPPLDRIGRWADHQLAYARRPEHALLAAMPAVARDLDAASRAELADSHRTLVEPLDDVLVELGLTDPADRGAARDLIQGLVLAAASREARTGGPDPVLRARLTGAIAGAAATPA